jgi:hypothetical protein
MSIPRSARTLLKQRDIILKAFRKDRITATDARSALQSLQWQHEGSSWVIRVDLDHARLVRTGPDGRTETIAETPSWLARWWPALPLAALSALALWGFVTSTADKGRVSDDQVVRRDESTTTVAPTQPQQPPRRPSATTTVPPVTIRPPQPAD